MKALFAALILMTTASAHAASMTFVKIGDPALILKIDDSKKSAQILERDLYVDSSKGEKALSADKVLIEGRVKIGKDGVLTIEKQEGEVCPAVKIALFDSADQKSQVAAVKIPMEETGTARKHCSPEKYEGPYARE